MDRAASGGLTALCRAAQGSLLSGCPSGCSCLSPGPEALDGEEGGTVTSIQGASLSLRWILSSVPWPQAPGAVFL